MSSTTTPGEQAVSAMASTLKAAEASLRATLGSLRTVDAQAQKFLATANATDRLSGTRAAGQIATAQGGVGAAMVAVVDAHNALDDIRAAAGLPPVITPRDAGGGK